MTVIYNIYFTVKYFDSSENEINLNDLKNIKLITKQDIIDKKDNLVDSLKEYKTTILSNKSELIEKTKNIKFLFIKPAEKKQKIDYNEILETTKSDMKIFYQVIFQAPYNHRLLIMC
ncbi:MAG: hypothetical protein Q8S84_09650 [bacterium]|nr:hypothetical protein [bacterium]MDP3381677.1 hypothetical protein [bacterium]